MSVKRHLSLPRRSTLLLFGARGVGKSFLLETDFNLAQALFINLLDPAEEARFARYPNELIELVGAMPSRQTYVIIDEVQKVPKLLDVVHLLIESLKCKKYFILTGSSARKLKTSGANLLAGRAFVYHLYPFSYLELGEDFKLSEALRFGLLPKVTSFPSATQKQKFLEAYTQTYLKEEIWAEQLIRKLDPFRRFLEVAAQANGKILNYANIARDTGVDEKTIKNYFSLLEDTLIGFQLESFHHSFRKRLRESPKFYFFDVGVARALARTLSLVPTQGTSYYGELFEQFIIVECLKFVNYYHGDYKCSYLMTATGAEIDLVIERPGKPLLLIEIKSTNAVRENDLSAMKSLIADLPVCEAVCFSQDPRIKKIGAITVYPWQQGIRRYFAKS